MVLLSLHYKAEISNLQYEHVIKQSALGSIMLCQYSYRRSKNESVFTRVVKGLKFAALINVDLVGANKALCSLNPPSLGLVISGRHASRMTGYCQNYLLESFVNINLRILAQL